jgi:antitoxin component of MazEF toxin-antitoxin module
MVKIENNGTVILRGNGIAIYLPADMVKRLNLKADEKVELEVDEKNRKFKGKILKKGE